MSQQENNSRIAHPKAQALLDAGVREVECLFPGVGGSPRGKVLRARDCAAGKDLRIAEAILMQTVTGSYAADDLIGETDADIRLVPDWNTLRILPWSPHRAWLMHDCVDFQGAYSAFSSRAVLRRVLDDYAALGLTPVVAPEIEFYLFQRTGNEAAGFTQPGVRGGVAEVGQSAFSVESINDLEAFWTALDEALEKLDVKTDTWLHEMGPSQYEINLLHGDALEMADQVLLFKYAVREVAARHGLTAVFMAKPLSGEYGSSMHLHQSVVDAQGRNHFSLHEGPQAGEASPVFYAYIGGLQRYLGDFMAVFAPFINSWRRYVSDSAAPINLDWGLDNRTVALRTPRAAPVARRVENRLPGSDANPYLAIAASLACGLAGMKQHLEARPPVDHQSGYGRPRELPKGLEAALDRLQNSEFARSAFSPLFIDAYCSAKHMELDDFMHEVSPWERRILSHQA